MTASDPAPRTTHGDGPVPLLMAPFLESLRGDGIRTTFHDYERIHLALRTMGPWTADRLRSVLSALLAQDREQQAIFQRRFDQFFSLETEKQDVFSYADVRRVLVDLNTLGHQLDRPPRSPTSTSGPGPREHVLEVKRRYGTVWILFGILAFVGAGVIIAKIFWDKQPSTSLTFTPGRLAFGHPTISTTETRTLSVTNTGDVTVAISGTDIYGTAEFQIEDDRCKGTVLLPDESCPVEISLTPRSVERIVMGLRIHHSGPRSPLWIDLQGAGVVDIEESEGPISAMRTYQVPVISGVRPEPNSQHGGWKKSAFLSMAFLLTFVGYGGWLQRMRRPPNDEGVSWDPDGPRLFRAGRIGGDLPPSLDQEALDLMADALGYFQSETIGKSLDIERSVAATGRNGGIPQLIFARKKRVRSVIVLEDTLAESLAWFPIGRELAQGLKRRGVPVLYGRFSGVPDRLRTDDGSTIEILDLEDDRHGCLVLIFSDSKGLYAGSHRFVLEALSRWPQIAWMELREERYWDESTALPARYGLPVYPASREGLLRVLRIFTTEQGSDGATVNTEMWQGGPTGVASRLKDHDLERLLGDAVVWAQSCAMMVQPVSLGLLEAIRSKFHSDLPTSRIERLLALPGVSLNKVGLRFSKRLLALLRHSFLKRNDEARQRQVLEFLMTELRRAEPSMKDTLEHQTWEWKLERLRLELDPDRALKRLAELAKGPLGPAIAGDLSDTAPAARIQHQADVVPLRAMPRSQRGLQRLRILAPQSCIAEREAYPVSPWHQIVLTCLGIGCLAAGLWAAWIATSRSPMRLRWELDSGVPDAHLWLEKRQGNQWSVIEVRDLKSSGAFSLKRGESYMVRLLAFGHESALANTWSISQVDQDLVMGVGVAQRELLCRETMPEIGLIIERCRPDGTPPRQTGQADPRIGLVSQDPKRSLARPVLWESDQYDQVYIVSSPDGKVPAFVSAFESSVERIASDWYYWIDQVQLRWRALGQRPRSEKLAARPGTVESVDISLESGGILTVELLPDTPMCDYQLIVEVNPPSGPAPLDVEVSVDILGGADCEGPQDMRVKVQDGNTYTVEKNRAFLRFHNSAEILAIVDWSGVTRTESAAIEIVPRPYCWKLEASPSTVRPGEKSRLSWRQMDGVSARLNGMRVPVTGPWNVTPKETTAYNLTIIGSEDIRSKPCVTTVNVNVPKTEVTIVFRTLVAEGSVAVYANRQLALQETFSFDNRRTFKRKYLRGERGFDRTTSLELGHFAFGIDVEVEVKDGRQKLNRYSLGGELVDSENHYLTITVQEDLSLDVKFR